MHATFTYGGWLPNRPVGTGGPSNLVRWAGWVTAAGAALSGIGTGGEISLHHLQRQVPPLQILESTVEMHGSENVRTPGEDLVRIREVLKPAVSNLALTFGVSRQSVYNWLNGESVADENAARLRDLAHAADLLAHEGLPINAALLKRKFAGGRTLLQVTQAGESARDAALLLIRIHQRETAQRERMNARASGRSRTASADFDLPDSNDHA